MTHSEDLPSDGSTEPALAPSHTLKLLAVRPEERLRSLADAAALRANPGVMAEVAGRTDTGRVRSNNEDQFLIAALERSLLLEDSSFPTEAGTRLTDTPQGRLLIVADGIGGHEGGEIASAVAIDAMAHYAFATMPWVLHSTSCSVAELGEGLSHALEQAQQRIRRVAQRKGLDRDLGTTLTLAYVAWPDLYVVHVGDSRAYLLRDGELHRITRDHTLAQQLVDGHAMTEEEARHSHYSHVLVNAVGGRTDDIDVELHRVALQLDDQLLLCSDGLYDMVSEDEIVALLNDTTRDVPTVVDALVDTALTAGGRDNVTVVLARF